MMIERYYNEDNCWLPFDVFNGLELLDEVIDAFFSDGPSDPCLLRPATDLYETDKEYIIKVDLPDVQKNQVRIALLPRQLTIHVVGKPEINDAAEKCTNKELVLEHPGLVIEFPRPIVTTKVKSKLKNGILTLKIRKAGAMKPVKLKPE